MTKSFTTTLLESFKLWAGMLFLLPVVLGCGGSSPQASSVDKAGGPNRPGPKAMGSVANRTPSPQLSAIPWKAAADPSDAVLAMEELPPITVKGSLTFSSRNGTAVMFGNLVIDGMTVSDLRTGDVVGRIPKSKPMPEPKTLSPSGQYLVGRSLGITPMGSLAVWDTKQGKIVRDLKGSDLATPQVAEFLDEDHVLTLFSKSNRWTFGVWNVKSGEAEQQWSVEAEPWASFVAAAISPNARYIAVLDRQWLHAFDIAEQRCVGRIAWTEQLARQPASDSKLCFSADGSQLASLIAGHDASRFLSWDYSSGEVIIDAVHPSQSKMRSESSEAAAYNGPSLDCLPDGDWLLYGHLIVDGKTGEVNRLLMPATRQPRLFVADHKMVIARGQLTSATKTLALVDMEIAEKAPAPNQVAAAPKEIPWSATPDPRESATAMTLDLDSLPKGRESCRLYYPSRANEFVLCLYPKSYRLHSLTGETLEHGTIVRDSLAPFRLLDISPGGLFLATWDRNELLLRSFQSGETIFEKQGRVLRNVVGLEFIDDRELLIVLKQESSSELTFLFVSTSDGTTRELTTGSENTIQGGQLLSGSSTRLSPGARYLAAMRYDCLMLYDVSEHRCVGRSVLPVRQDRRVPQDCSGVAFSEDGRHVAALINYTSNASQPREPDSLLVWDVATGELQTNVDLDADSVQIARDESRSYDGRRLDGVPGNAGWFIHGRVLLDQSGAVVRMLPRVDYYPRQFVDSEHLLTVITSPKEPDWYVASIGVDAAENEIEQLVQRASLPTHRARDWNCRPDPPALQDVPINAEELSIELFDGACEPIYSHRPSPFVLLANSRTSKVFRLDRPQEPVWEQEHSLLVSAYPQDITLDASRLVVTSRYDVSVWSFEKGKEIYHCQPFDASPIAAEFLDSDRMLVTSRGRGLKIGLEVHDVANGQLIHKVECEHGSDYRAICVSPGGRYAVIGQRGSLYFYDLEAGLACGEVSLAMDQAKVQKVSDLAFSPDGRLLAMLAAADGDEAGQAGLIVVDLADGSLAFQGRYDPVQLAGGDEAVTEQSLNILQWLPGSSPRRLICWRSIIGLPNGEVEALLPPFESRYTRFIGVDRVLQLEELPSRHIRRLVSAAHDGVQWRALAPPPPQPVVELTEREAETAKRFERGVLLWKAEPDPPATPLPTSGKEYAQTLPSLHRITIPHQPSQFIMIHAEDQNRHAVFDTQNGVFVEGFGVEADLDYSLISLSGDGRLLAGSVEGDRRSVFVWSLEDGKQLCQISTPRYLTRVIEITSSGRLLTASGSRDVRCSVWNAQTGAKVSAFEAEAGDGYGREDSGASVSPGGRYAAVLNHGTLRVWEMDTGKLVGMNNELLIHGRDTFKCSALHFSPEGDELIGLFTSERTTIEMARWDFRTGKLAQYSHLGSMFVPHGQPPAPELCVLSGHGIFLHRANIIVDHHTGVPVYQFALPKCESVIQQLDLDRLLVVRYNSSTRKRELVTATLPRSAIIQAVKAVRSDPSRQPFPLTKTDHIAKETIVAPKEPVPWSVKPGPALPAQTTASGGVPLSAGPAPTEVYIKADQGKGYALYNRQEPLVPQAVGPQGLFLPVRRSWLDVFSLATGESEGQRILIRPLSKVMDVSPDGDLVMTYSQQGHNVPLDIWSVRSGRHALSWVPEPELMGISANIPTAFFVDKRHVLTVWAGRLTQWNLPECTVGYTVRNFGFFAAISADRRYVVGFGGGLHQLVCIDTSNGQCVGTPQLPIENMSRINMPHAAGFSGDGRSLVHQFNNRILTWNMANGELTRNFEINPAESAARCIWLNDRYVLFYEKAYLQSNFLVDIENRAVVRQYCLPDGRKGFPAKGATRDAIWYCLEPTGKSDVHPLVMHSPLPLPSDRAACEAVTFESQVIAGPGTHLNYSVNNQTEFSSYDAESNLRLGLEQSGYVPDRSASLHLHVDYTEKKGKVLSNFFRFLRTSPEETIQTREIQGHFKITDPRGEVLWSRESTVAHMRVEFIEKGTREEVIQRLETNLQESAATFFTKPTALPKYIFPTSSKKEAPKSELPVQP